MGDVDMELEDLEADRSRAQAEKDAHATRVNRARYAEGQSKGGR